MCSCAGPTPDAMLIDTPAQCLPISCRLECPYGLETDHDGKNGEDTPI